MLGCLGEVADGLRGRVGWERDRLRGSLRAIQPYYYRIYLESLLTCLVRIKHQMPGEIALHRLSRKDPFPHALSLNHVPSNTSCSRRNSYTVY